MNGRKKKKEKHDQKAKEKNEQKVQFILFNVKSAF